MISAATRFRQITDTQQVDPAGSGSSGVLGFSNVKASAGGLSFRDSSSWVFRGFGVAGLLMVLIPAFFILLEMVTPWPVTKLVENVCGPICHHIPDRTINLHQAMPVCARCAGLYCGWLLAATAFHRIPELFIHMAEGKTRGVLVGLFLLFSAAVLEAGLEAIGWVTLANWSRLVIGLPLGLFPAFVLLLGTKTLLAEAHRSVSGTLIRKGTS